MPDFSVGQPSLGLEGTPGLQHHITGLAVPAEQPMEDQEYVPRASQRAQK